MTMAQPILRIDTVTCPTCGPDEQSYVYVSSIATHFDLTTQIDSKGYEVAVPVLVCHCTYYRCSRGHDWMVQNEF